MTGYLRTELHHFPALKKFTKDVSLELKLFSHFLHEVEELELSNEILSALSLEWRIIWQEKNVITY